MDRDVQEQYALNNRENKYGQLLDGEIPKRYKLLLTNILRRYQLENYCDE
ncbi:MAG: hypothetical protein CM15mV43_750 [uncultured marine virus]|nr:MAG: hypothetical protein CM15mV43_750 [uncultured marine virus]